MVLSFFFLIVYSLMYGLVTDLTYSFLKQYIKHRKQDTMNN